MANLLKMFFGNPSSGIWFKCQILDWRCYFNNQNAKYGKVFNYYQYFYLFTLIIFQFCIY